MPERPTLYELFLNDTLYALANGEKPSATDMRSLALYKAKAFAKLGYDFVSMHASGFGFPRGERDAKETISLNAGFLITDRKSFDEYPWPDPDDFDNDWVSHIAPDLPDGMKIKIMGPCGVLENAIALVGYDNLCFMLYEDPDLAGMVFESVGERLVRYYKNVLEADCSNAIGLISSNDDWGFNTQTFLSPEMMRKYVFPWHKKIVDLSHAFGRPVLLHSCGNMEKVIDDIVAIGFDAKHSFEDKIIPVEDAYEAWHDRIALLGGIDMNFLCTRPEEEIALRAYAMLERVGGAAGMRSERAIASRNTFR